MKKQLLKLSTVVTAVVFAALMLTTSCAKEDPNSFLGSIAVQLTIQNELSDFPIENIEVTLQSSSGAISGRAISDNSGKVLYEALPVGTYIITVVHNKAEEEFTLTGRANNVIVSQGQRTDVTLELRPSITNSGLVFKEVKYTAADDIYHTLWKDQFLEIFNNSSETIYLDGMYIGTTYGTLSKVMPHPYTEDLDIDNYLYLQQIFQFPGSGTDYPIEASKSILFAYNAINFKEGSPMPENSLDLTGADFDIYAVDWLEAQGAWPNEMFDIQNPDVTDCIPIFLPEGSQNWFGLDFNSGGVVMFRSETPLTFEANGYIYSHGTIDGYNYDVPLMKIPVGTVIDGMEYLEDASITNMKTLPASIDASYIYIYPEGNAHYSGKSFRRKIDQAATTKYGRLILQDLNDTALDFDIIDLADPKGYANL